MANAGTDLAHLVVLLLGALCVLLGFFLVVRGVGAAESESSVRVVGVEVKVSKVGPGILFALIGVVLVYFGLQPAQERNPAPDVVVNEKPQPAETTAPTPTAQADPRSQTVSKLVATARTTVPRQAVALTPPADLFNARHQREMVALRRAIEEQAAGRCPEDLLSPAIVQACQSQAAMAPAILGAKGKIIDIRFDGKASESGTLNFYKVRFENDEMRWTVGLGSDGKLFAVYSPL